MLTIAVAALELSQTVWEEEVLRQALMSAPTRVRRFLSRFMVVVVAALAIESLVSAFHFVHGDRDRLPHAAAVAFGAASLLLAWGGVRAAQPVCRELGARGHGPRQAGRREERGREE